MAAEEDRPGSFDASNFSSYRREMSRIADIISGQVDGLDDNFARAYRAAGVWIGLVINAPDRSDGVTFAFSQLTNEFCDLLFDCAGGQGRSALKASRSLFELLITVKDVTRDETARERYEDHRWVVFDLAAALEGQKPERRKGQRYRRKKASAYAKRHLDPVMKKYGSRFRISWRSDNLADAAARHGLSDEYDFYRLSSGVLHGSSGGVLGQYAMDRIEGADVPVYRTGLALSLCPDAFRQGVKYFRLAVLDSEALVGPGGIRDLLLACDDLLRISDDYEDALDQLDAEWWVTVERARVYAIACIDLRGGLRWMLHDTAKNQMREAEPPTDLSSEQLDSIESLRERRRQGKVVSGIEDYKVVTVHIQDVHLVAKPDSTWQPAGIVLQQPRLSIEGRSGFTSIERPPEWFRDLE